MNNFVVLMDLACNAEYIITHCGASLGLDWTTTPRLTKLKAAPSAGSPNLGQTRGNQMINTYNITFESLTMQVCPLRKGDEFFHVFFFLRILIFSIQRRERMACSYSSMALLAQGTGSAAIKMSP